MKKKYVLPNAEDFVEIYGSAKEALKYLRDPLKTGWTQIYWTEADDINLAGLPREKFLKATAFKKKDIQRRLKIVEELETIYEFERVCK